MINYNKTNKAIFELPFVARSKQVSEYSHYHAHCTRSPRDIWENNPPCTLYSGCGHKSRLRIALHTPVDSDHSATCILFRIEIEFLNFFKLFKNFESSKH